MTNFPSKIDTDAELPRIDDNVTEVVAAVINSIRDAIIAVERTIGENPQGATASLVSRLATALNDDGTLKASALAAAGLVTLPIVNAQVGSSAAIEEQKLDLDFPTAELRNDINSNDIDIAQLQKAIADLLYRFGIHINGLGLKHDSFDILLDDQSPSVTPPAFISLTAVDVGNALIEMNNRFLDHASASKIGAHKASNISVNNVFETFSADEVQGALEGLDKARFRELIIHRDDMHANGFIANASDLDGYSSGLQLVPITVGTSAAAIIVSNDIIDFSPLVPGSLSVTQSSVVIVYTAGANGTYAINDVGPRAAVGIKPALTSTQVEIAGVFPTTGAVQARIYGVSSLPLLKGNGAPTVYQSDLKVDSVQLSRPNAARVVSLGIQPVFITAGMTLDIEVGVADGVFRTISITNLHYDRTNSPAAAITVDTVVERINYVFENRVDGNAFPAAAYRIGNEIQIAHNWIDDFATLRILSTGTANFFLGFDSFGANILDLYNRPTENSYYYVNGVQLSDYASIIQATASVAVNTFTFTNVNPITAGVKVGNLLHLRSHSNSSQLGTYFITSLTPTTITVAKNAGIVAQASVDVEVLYDAAALDEYNTATTDLVLEVYLTSLGTVGVNERINYTDVISNLNIVDVSDNYLPTSSAINLVASTSGTSVALSLNGGKAVLVPSSFVGLKYVYGPSNIESIQVNITGPLGTGTSSVNIFEHIDEEEYLEVCSVRLDGLLTASKIVDKRLFGSTGLQELREDIIQRHIETPTRELRSNGIIYGFDILDSNYTDPSFPVSPSYKGILVRGGVAYIGGVRADVPTASVIFPNVAGTYTVAIDSLGTFKQFDNSVYPVDQLLDGYAGELALVANVVHDGTNVTSAVDSRFFVDKLDEKVELLIDETNHFIGHFASFDAAKQYINNWPTGEKFKVRIVSYTASTIDTSGLNREVTIVIDGQVGNVIANSNCKITSDSIAGRTEPHITGTLTTYLLGEQVEVSNLLLRAVTINPISSTAVISFDNVVIDGDSSSIFTATGSGAVESLKLSNVKFNSGFGSLNLNGLSSGTVILEKCGFSSSSDGNIIFLGGDRVLVDRCGFSNVSIFYQKTGNLNIRSSRFKTFSNTTASSVIGFVNATLVTIDSCVFSGVALDINDMISSGSVQTRISNCLFQTCVAAPNKFFVKVPGTVDGCLFTGCTFTTSAAVRTDTFSNNKLLTPTNECLIQATQYVGNNGFHAVQPGSSGIGTPLRLVRSNIFPSNSGFGFTVDFGGSGSSSSPIVENNYITTTTVGVKLNAAPFNACIKGNIISGSGTAIDFGGVTTTDLDVVVEGNQFTTTEPFTSSAAIKGLLICNNMLKVTAGTFTFGANVQINDNYFTGAAFGFSALGAVGCRIVDNIFKTTGTIAIGALTSGVVSGNYIDTTTPGSTLTFTGTFVNTAIENNIAPIVFGIGSTANDVLFSGNIGTFTGSDQTEWRNSLISDNVFAASSGITFLLYSDVSSNNANVRIQNNIFNDALSFTSVNPMHGMSFVDNLNATSSSVVVNFIASLNAARVTGNFNFSFTFTGGAQAVIISENVSLTGTMTLLGSINSALFNSNYCSVFDIQCGSSGGLVLSDNFLADSMNVLNLSTGIKTIDGSTITGNYIVNGFNTLSATTDAAANLSLTNTLISTNRIGQVSILDLTNATGATGSHSFSGNKFLQNVVVGSLEIFDTSTNLSGTTFANNRFGNNDINGAFNMRMSATATTSATTLSNITFDNNVFSSSVVWSGEWDGYGVYLKNCFLSSTFTYNIERQSVRDSTAQNISIVDNILFGDILIRKTTSSGTPKTSSVLNLSISSNIGPSSVISLSRTDTSSNVFVLTNVNISDNICSRIDLNVASSSLQGYTVSGVKIGGNIFSNDTALSGLNVTNSSSSCAISFSNGLITNNASIARDGYLANIRIDPGPSGVLSSTIVTGNESLNLAITRTARNATISDWAIVNNKFGAIAVSNFTMSLSSFSSNSLTGALTFSGNLMQNIQVISNFVDSVVFTGMVNLSSNIRVAQNNITTSVTTLSSGATGISDITFSGNVIGNTASGFFTYTDTNITNVVFNNNTSYVPITFTAVKNASNLSINNNILNDADVIVAQNGTGVLGTKICNGLSISHNNFHDTDNNVVTVTGNNLNNFSIRGNYSTTNTAKTRTFTITGDFLDGVFSDNSFIGNATINAIVNGFNVSGNTLGNGNLSFGDSVISLILANNNFGGDVSFSANPFSFNTIAGNIQTAGGLFDLSLVTSVSRCLIHSNKFGTMALPNLTIFSSDDNQSKIYFNFAEEWTAPSAFATAGSSRVFPWGNTSSTGSANVNFNGTTAINVTTANNVNTGGGFNS